jgi:hypothetical protein
MAARALSFAFVIGVCCQLTVRGANAQVIHTAHDHVPNFAASPTIRSAAHGSWSSPATWNPARLPGPADVVSITHTVTYSTTDGSAAAIGVDDGGMLRFSTTAPTLLRVGTLQVLPRDFHPQATANLYGGIAPCSNTTARPEIDGITCGSSTSLSAPTGLVIVR